MKTAPSFSSFGVAAPRRIRTASFGLMATTEFWVNPVALVQRTSGDKDFVHVTPFTA